MFVKELFYMLKIDVSMPKTHSYIPFKANAPVATASIKAPSNSGSDTFVREDKKQKFSSDTKLAAGVCIAAFIGDTLHSSRKKAGKIFDGTDYTGLLADTELVELFAI